jgi:hypothetical protein
MCGWSRGDLGTQQHRHQCHDFFTTAAAITSLLGSDGVQSTDNTNAHNLGLFLKVGFPSSRPQFWQELQNAGSK